MEKIKDELFKLNTNLTLRQVELISKMIEDNYVRKEDAWDYVNEIRNYPQE
jgi:hypothetical protein